MRKDIRKKLNILGNILFYTFNVVTLPIIIGILCYHIPDNLVIEEFIGDTNSSFIIAIVLFIITWRLQFIIADVFSSSKKFGIDFFKYRNIYEKLIARKPEFNSIPKSNELYELFKYYCIDEKTNIIHSITKHKRELPNGEDLSRIDLNLYHGYNNTFIVDKGYIINLDDEPPMYLTRVKTRFSPMRPSYGFCKYFISFMKDELVKLTTAVGEKNINVMDNMDVTIHEYCIVMGSLVDMISDEQYNELLLLHKDGEKKHDRYMLRKRQSERKACK